MPDPAPPSPPPPIFLSYASEDAAAARRIAEALGQAGLVVWFDQSELRGGDAWDQRIRRQIKDCALFIPVISAQTQARAEGYFRLEWHLAEQHSFLMAHDKPFIIPVVVDETPDAGARVPDRFRERQWTRLPGGQVPPDFAPRLAQLLGRPALLPRPGPAAAPAAAPPRASERSVAVLAFSNLSRDEENEYFAEGVADELLTVLQNVRGLRVAARTSAFFFKGKNASLQEIGSALDVAHLVEGGVQKAGNRVKVSARLTNVATGVLTWSRSYTREIQDVFALQEELALAIVGELRGQLEGDDTAAIQQANRGGTRMPAAYECYLLGRHLFEQSAEGPVAQAALHLRRATELDPEFALAWVALASAHLWRCSYLASLTREDFDTSLAAARQAVARGLSLEPELAAGLGVLGNIQLTFDFDMKGAVATLRRAEAIAPSDREVLLLASRLIYTARTSAQAVERARRIVARDPINPRPHLALAHVLAEGGHFDEARREAARYRELAPAAIWANSAAALILAMEGRFAEAEQTLNPTINGWPELWLRSIIYHGLGRTAEADAGLAHFIAQCGAAAAVQIAEIHAFRGEADLAFQWLETAHQQRDSGLFQTYRDMFFRNIVADSRWDAFWGKLGIEPDVSA